MPRIPARALLFTALLSASHAGATAGESPYELRTEREAWLLGGGFVLGGASIGARNSKTGLSPDEIAGLSRSDVNAFDRGATWHYSEPSATASDVLVYGLIASPALMLIDSRVRSEWKTYAFMYAETMLLTFSTVELVKNLVDRPRPFVYNPDAPMIEKTDPDARRSFYSSHTAFAFGSAVFLSMTYSEYFPGSRWTPFVWGGSLVAASAVGVLRYSAGMHFPTDILIGAAIGGTLGSVIPLIHRRGEEGVELGISVFEDTPMLRIVVRL